MSRQIGPNRRLLQSIISTGSISDPGYRYVSTKDISIHSSVHWPEHKSEEEIEREEQEEAEAPFWQLGGLGCCCNSQCKSQEVLENQYVQAFVIGTITVNAVVIGFETDMPHAFKWDLIEDIFLVIFTFELALRLHVFGVAGYFKCWGNPDFAWNLFDFTVVMCGLVNLTLGVFANKSHADIVKITRLLRILRVLRVMKIVRFLKQLYLLAYGFVEAAMAIFWVTTLAVFILYICAVILVKTYGRIKVQDEVEQDFFDFHFGTIPQTMFSLFELIVTPDLKAYKSIMFENPPLVIFLVSFIILGGFGFNGLLVALINESILEKNQARLEQDRMDREVKRKVMRQRCGELFDALDVNKNRVLPREELMQCTQQLAEVFEVLGINFQREDLGQMVKIMDHHDTGIIERSEFVQGVLELCDQIRPMSIMELHFQISKCAAKVEQADTKVEDLAKIAENHDQKLEEAGSAVERLRAIVEPPAGAVLPQAPGLARAPNPPQQPLFLELRRALAQTLTSVEAVLAVEQVDGRCDAAVALGEGLLELHRCSQEMLGGLGVRGGGTPQHRLAVDLSGV